MILYDFDGIFDKKISNFIEKNKDKFTEEQFEDMIPKLYNEFGDAYLKVIDDTPNGFFAKMSDKELVFALKKYLEVDGNVTQFLTKQIESRDMFNFLFELLDGSENERVYAINFICSDKRALSDKAIDKYIQILTARNNKNDNNSRWFDGIIELLQNKADDVKDRILSAYKATHERYFLEILSSVKNKEDKIFQVLLDAFLKADKDLDIYIKYLVDYGDERALKYFIEKIDQEGIGYKDYKELIVAIERFGGTYDKKRDFSLDPLYIRLKSTPSSWDEVE